MDATIRIIVIVAAMFGVCLLTASRASARQPSRAPGSFWENASHRTSASRWQDGREEREERPLGAVDQEAVASPQDESAEDDPEKETDEEEEDEDEEEEDEEEAVETLFGEELHTFGPIAAEYLYTGEVFNNARGGISTSGATRYRGNLDLTLTLDTASAGWWQGGSLFAYVQQSHGETLTQRFVGDGQYYSNIDTGLDQDITQFAEYWYQQTFDEDRLAVKLGRQDANENFAFADLGGDFINSSFVTIGNIPMPVWPYQTLAVSALYQPNEKLRLGGGVWDQGQDFAQWWVTTVSRGMFYIGQLDYQPNAGVDGALPTLFRFGVWYGNSDVLGADGVGRFEDNYGFYATLDQMLFLEASDPEEGTSEQGLGGFLQWSWAPGDRNQVDLNYGAGLVYRGLVPCRDEDTIGAGFTLIDFSSRVRAATGQTFENAIEFFYKARLRDGLALQPDLQYIVRPNGIERDALVIGVRFEANF